MRKSKLVLHEDHDSTMFHCQAMSTFVDDVAAFLIDMPMMHRSSRAFDESREGLSLN